MILSKVPIENSMEIRQSPSGVFVRFDTNSHSGRWDRIEAAAVCPVRTEQQEMAMSDLFGKIARLFLRR
jgi:hypothetical protein